MSHADLAKTIDDAFEKRNDISPSTKGPVRDAVETALDLLDRGKARVAERGGNGAWTVNQWLKKAVLLSFRLSDNGADRGRRRRLDLVGQGADQVRRLGQRPLQGGRLPRRAGQRGAPLGLYRAERGADAVVREPRRLCRLRHHGRHLGDGRLLRADRQELPLSGGAGIGGVLEPLQADPVIIEDNCFIGARAEVAEGVVVREGSVLSMGVYLGASTKIVDRATGEVFQGEVPPYSVVVSGTMPGKPMANGEPGPSLYCAVIVKRVDEKTRSKTSINELLRD